MGLFSLLRLILTCNNLTHMMPLQRLRIACGRGAPRRVRRLCHWSRLRLAFYSRARPAWLRHRRRQLGPPIACAYVQHFLQRSPRLVAYSTSSSNIDRMCSFFVPGSAVASTFVGTPPRAASSQIQSNEDSVLSHILGKAVFTDASTNIADTAAFQVAFGKNC